MRASPLTGGGCSDAGPLAPSFSISPFPGPAYVGRGTGGKGDPHQRGQVCGVGVWGVEGRPPAEGAGLWGGGEGEERPPAQGAEACEEWGPPLGGQLQAQGTGSAPTVPLRPG